MNYQQAVNYIHSTRWLGSKPGLSRIITLLDYLKNPHKQLKFVHVAGTNGKGSTCTIISAVLTASGYKTGLFISPFVVDFRERIQINKQLIAKTKLSKAVAFVKKAIAQMTADGHDHPTEYEILTAVAFVHFAWEQCQIVVLETGMGGRFDMTNVIDPPLVSVITSISLDHTQYLGNTIEEIAYQKAGIIKHPSPVVCYPKQNPKALQVIKDTCHEQGCQLHIPDLADLEIKSAYISGNSIVYAGAEYEIPLVGVHQIYNFLTALCTLNLLGGMGYSLCDVNTSMRGLSFGGRLEIIRKTPLCLIDGAHNTDGVEALANTIDTVFNRKRVITVMGMMQDKDYAHTIPQLAKRSAVFVAVQDSSFPRCLPARQAMQTAQPHCRQCFAFETVAEGAKFALENAGPEDVIIGCGSLYLIGGVKKILGS